MMRKYALCAAASALLLLGGISAGAADAPTAEELLQIIPAEVQQQAQAGNVPEGQTAMNDSLSIQLGKSNGSCCIVEVFRPEANLFGVFDFAAQEWRIPCTYHGIYQIPGPRYLLVMNSGDKSDCYEASADGTVNPDPLPIYGNVCGADEEGYVTLYRYVDVASSNPNYAEQETGSYVQLALLDSNYQTVLDYTAEAAWPTPISFLNGTAIIQSGSKNPSFAGHHQVNLDGTYGIINRKGEWVGKHDYSNIYRYENDANQRVFGTRNDKLYWVTEDGSEVPLNTIDHSSLADRVSDWASSAVEQAKSRNLVPEQLQGYYTLDIYREEFCSLLMSVYRAMGKEVPSTDSAPAFTDCTLEDVRLVAALNVVSGYDDGTFRPRSRISREEAAAILSRFTALFQTVDETVSSPYQDDAEIGSWAKPQVYAMQNAGIMSGVSDGRFSPKGTYTIEQAISVVNRLYDMLSAQ